MIYLDTSAALKLVLPEAETAGLELWIAERAGIPRVSSRLLRIEMRGERDRRLLSQLAINESLPILWQSARDLFPHAPNVFR